MLDCVRRIPPALRTAAADDFARQHAFLTMRLTLRASRWLRVAQLAPFRTEYERRASGSRSMVMDLLLPKRDDETGSAAASHFSALGPR